MTVQAVFIQTVTGHTVTLQLMTTHTVIIQICTLQPVTLYIYCIKCDCTDCTDYDCTSVQPVVYSLGSSFVTLMSFITSKKNCLASGVLLKHVCLDFMQLTILIYD